MRPPFFIVAVIASLALQSTGSAAEWGSVEFTFLYAGKPPEVKPFPPGGRAGGPARDETWLVDKKGGVKNVVVRLLPEKDVPLPIHPDFEKAKGTSARIDIVGGYFEPRITIKYTNQDLLITNLDAMGHNAHGDSPKNQPFSLVIRPNNSCTLEAGKGGLNVHDNSCGFLSDSIYPGMKGYFFIHSHPYAGVSDAQGKVTLKNVPVGEWTFVLWHEAGGYIKQGTQGETAKEWPKGRIKIKVEPEKTTTVEAIKFK